MKRILPLIICALLCGCASDSNSSSPADTKTSAESTASTTTTVSETVTTTTAKAEPQKIEYRNIDVSVMDYRDGKLYFEYEGKNYETEMKRSVFSDGALCTYSEHDSTMSERIIHNRFGEKIKAVLKISEDMSEIFKCDVISPNGKEYSGYIPDIPGEMKSDLTYCYSFRRTGGSKCEIYNKDETLSLDLNDLQFMLKFDYPNEMSPVTFKVFKFKSGNMILHDVAQGYIRDGFLMSEQPTDLREGDICYFGTVQKNVNDTTEVLLNDGKTVITIPSYYNDGELTEGLQIMALVNTKNEELFGSGEQKTFDYVLVFTDQERFNKSQKDFSELAYAKVKNLLEESFEYILIQ